MKTSSTSSFLHTWVPGRSANTLLLLHGTGGTENDLLPLGRALDPDASLLSPRGKILENGMPRFFRRLAEGVFDEEDLVNRTHELADFVEQAAADYGFDRKKLFAVGYSNGANIAGALLLLRPGTLAGAVLMRAMVPLVPETLPRLQGAPVLIAEGDHDPIVSVEEARSLAALLRSAGAEVTDHFDNAGHGLSEGTVTEARRWIAAHLK